MNILRRLRNGKSAVRIYNQWRLGFAVLGPMFVIMGVAAIFGFGNVRAAGEEVTGIERVIMPFVLMALGALFCYLRATAFREKRKYSG
jgi:hypothetical protein